MDILPYMIFSHEVKRPFDKRSYEHRFQPDRQRMKRDTFPDLV